VATEPEAGPYWTVAVTLRADAPEALEGVTNRLWELGAVGVVEEEEVSAGRAVLRAFFPPDAEPAELDARIRGYLDELLGLGIAAAPEAVLVEPLADAPWAEAWRAHFRPVPAGARFLVCAPWHAPAADSADGREILLIEPGRAFGTGAHGSTRTCLVLLERALPRPVARAIDVGAGSGILAIAAARAGVARVEALDVDPDAVAATADNARRNGVADRVVATLTDVATWAGPPAPLVLANLLAAAHAGLAPVLVALTAPGGALIAGGLLVHEVPAVTGAFAAAGAALIELTEEDGWAALLLERGP
jgi:ribosomal protein L11 methyltransferase